MQPGKRRLSGRIDECVIDSHLLRGNPLGDPHERDLWVYLPPGYDHSPAQRYPTIYVLQGYLGQLQMWHNRAPFLPTFIESADHAFVDSEVPPAILVFVDAWTTYGGSQFLDSTGTGDYHSYLCNEIVPWVDGHYRTLADRQHRAIVGKSSGGFGAMVTSMLRPDLFGAFASHAGDVLFEYTCFTKFPLCLRHLRAYDGDIGNWWDDFRKRSMSPRPGDVSLLILLGMSACFSAAEDGSPQLPFDPSTGELRPEIWARWQRWDPVRMVPGHAAALRSMHSIWIDAGSSDEQYLDIGAAAFHAALERVGVPASTIRFELFPGGHGGIEHRYPQSLAWLAGRLAIGSEQSGAPAGTGDRASAGGHPGR